MSKPKLVTTETDAAAAMRRRLSKGGTSKPRATMAGWFDTHKEAREFVKLWYEMTCSGESVWPARRVYAVLVEEHAFPFRTYKHLGCWFRDYLKGEDDGE